MSIRLSRLGAWLEQRPLVLFAALYAGVAILALVLPPLLPAPLALALHELTGGAGLAGVEGGRIGQAAELPQAALWAIALIAMGSAGLLALPLAWLYTVTRKKRGYHQSSVHALILLPVVVAGVVVLVKFSLALAFSLAGIVAAVRFRHTLEDSKDAIYIFAVTGVGLAAGVELSVAATISLVFSLVTVLLFNTDFGRAPAPLEGRMAEERMQRALAIANRTSQFVARVDKEILEQLAPAQLEALADRALQRRQEAAEAATGERPVPRNVVTLHVVTDGATGSREAVESVLGQLAKEWRFRAAQAGPDGGQTLDYVVRIRKSVETALFIDAVRRAAGGVRSAELA